MAGQSFELAPGLGWANAVPDANGQVNLMLNGEPLQFNGSGYHDKVCTTSIWVIVSLSTLSRTGAPSLGILH